MNDDETIPSAALDAAEALFAASGPEAALPHFQRLVDEAPACARAWNDLGATLYALGNAAGARNALDRAFLLDPDDPDVLRNVIELHVEAERFGQALLPLRRLLDQAPEDTEFTALTGWIGITHSRAPRALFLDAPATLGRRRRVLRGILREAGFDPRNLPESVRLAASRLRGQDPSEFLAAALDVIRPGLVFVDDSIDAATREHIQDQGAAIVASETLAAATDDLAARELLLAHLERAPLVRSEGTGAAPILSVVVRAPQLFAARTLLDRLCLQDLDPSLFEVRVGATEDAELVRETLETDTRPFTVEVHGEGRRDVDAARAAAHAAARGPLVLLLDGDVQPVENVLRQHLLAHADAERPVAVQGRIAAADLETLPPLTRAGIESGLNPRIMDEPGAQCSPLLALRPAHLSFPRATLDAAGGLPDGEEGDADLELAARLVGRGGLEWTLARSARAHRSDLGRARELPAWHGRNARERFALARRHPELDRDALGIGLGDGGRRLRAEARRNLELGEASLAPSLGRGEDPLDDTPEREDPLRSRQGLRQRLTASCGCAAAEALLEALGSDVARPTPRGLAGELTSIIMLNLNGLPHVVPAIESLRRHTRGPWELIVVDNGSSDGSLPWLREQPDLTLLEMGENVGAPAGRNEGLSVARGSTILFTDNDVVFTPRWREILIAHLDSWPEVGLVGPMSDYVSGLQATTERPASGEKLDAFAQRFHEERAGVHAYADRLILFFLLARREVIERIGGIDPRYGRWGFEDDDYCVRARLAGFDLRVASDCFIRHLGSQTAKAAHIDYGALLARNFQVFKDRFELPADLSFEAYGDDPSRAIRRGFDPRMDHVAIPSTPRVAPRRGGSSGERAAHAER